VQRAKFLLNALRKAVMKRRGLVVVIAIKALYECGRRIFMFGWLTKMGVTKGLQALGADKDTAKAIGLVCGAVVTVLTFDVVSVAAESVGLVATAADTFVGSADFVSTTADAVDSTNMLLL
jgi:hypothetical protein